MDSRSPIFIFFAVANLVVWVLFLPWQLLGSPFYSDYLETGAYALVLIFGVLALRKKSIAYLLISILCWGIPAAFYYHEEVTGAGNKAATCNRLRGTLGCIEEADGTMKCDQVIATGICSGVPK